MITARIVVYNGDDVVDIMEIDRDVVTRATMEHMAREFGRQRMALEQRDYTLIEIEWP